MANSAVSCFHIGCLKRRLANYQRVNNDSQRPDIHFIGVATLAFKHFRSDIVWCAANCSFFLAIKVEFGRKSKVTKLDFHLVVQKQIAQFEVTMDDAMRMQVLQSVDNLHSVALDFQLVQPLPPLEQFIHTLVLTQFKQYVHIFSILEEVLELAYVVVLNAPVDFNFTHQLLLCTAFSQARLLNNLGSMHIISFSINEFPTFSKTSFTQKLALDIPSCPVLVSRLVFLFNQRILSDRVLYSIWPANVSSPIDQHLFHLHASSIFSLKLYI